MNGFSMFVLTTCTIIATLYTIAVIVYFIKEDEKEGNNYESESNS